MLTQLARYRRPAGTLVTKTKRGPSAAEGWAARGPLEGQLRILLCMHAWCGFKRSLEMWSSSSPNYVEGALVVGDRTRLEGLVDCSPLRVTNVAATKFQCRLTVFPHITGVCTYCNRTGTSFFAWCGFKRSREMWSSHSLTAN